MVAVDPIRVMQLHDGELGADEAIQLDAEMEAQGLRNDVRAVRAGLDQLGDFIRAHAAHEAEARAEALAGLTDSILERLHEAPASRTRKLESPGLPTLRTLHAVALVGGALALAASVALVVWGGGALQVEPIARPSTRIAPSAEVAQVPRGRASAEAELARLDPALPGVSIEMVDFGARSGTIFMVTSGEDALTPVVWLVDESPEGEASASFH